jgi:hypothetical protein
LGGPEAVDANGDGVPDGIDNNGDGVADITGTAVDTDGDGVWDGLDTDGDGIPDVNLPAEGGNLPPRPAGCNDLQVEFESVIPTVMLVVDRSSSMFDTPLAPFANRWDPLKDALVGETGAVTNLHEGIRFGFSAYTHQYGNGVAACPTFDFTSIGLGNYDAIKAQYDAVSSDVITPGLPNDPATNANPTKGETPTGAAVTAAAAQLAAFTEPGPKFILLVTDGEPDTCTMTDPQCGQDESIAAVQAAHAQGIGTFAIGVGEIGVDHLQDLANAGLGQPVMERPEPASCVMGSFTQGAYSPTGGTAKVFNPADPETLKADIAGIVGSTRTCTYTLNEVVDLEKAHLGTVLVNNVTAVHGDPNGWQMNSELELEILGASCNTIKTSAVPDVFISFPCESFVK